MQDSLCPVWVEAFLRVHSLHSPLEISVYNAFPAGDGGCKAPGQRDSRLTTAV